MDAVVFTGGEDIAPTLYRIPEPWHGIEAERDYNATRDVSDYLTMMYALDHDMPVMGMCRGMQMLATVSGATMIQDIPVWFAQQGITYTYMHRNQKHGEEKRDYAPHDVTVSNRSSILYAMSGSETIVGAPSWHHQVVGSVDGTALEVTGYTYTNGFNFIEAIERTDKQFCIGLQFHPEAAVTKHLYGVGNAALFMSYSDALRYFQKLIDEVKKRKEAK